MTATNDTLAAPHQSLATLFAELTEGAPGSGAYILNSGDAGLLAGLDGLPASAASTIQRGGGAPIAAHVEHLRYGISLMNRWANGEQNPWASADWRSAWRITAVDDAEWTRLRAALRDECRRWLAALRVPRTVNGVELNGMIGTLAHLAYHVGAIRQIDRSIKGPAEAGSQNS